MDHVGRCGVSAPDVDAVFVGDDFEIAGDLADIGVFGLLFGEPHLAAQRPVALEQRHLVPAPDRRFCDLEASRSAADHNDGFGDFDRRQQALVDLALAPGAWILDAADRLFLAHLKDAGVVAGDAAAHELGAAAPRLLWRPRVGDQLSRHADEIGLAGAQRFLAQLRRIHAAEGNDRQAAHLLQLAIDLAEILQRHGGRRDFHPVTGERSGIGIEIVDKPARLEILRDLQAIFGIVAEHGKLVDADAHAERNTVSRCLLDRLEHLDRQAQAVLERSAIGIGPVIEKRRCEGAQQAVMGDLHFDAVEARLDQVAGTRREAIDYGTDVVVVDRLGAEVARRLRHLGRRPQDMRRMFERGVAAMGQLAEDLGAMGMDAIGHPAVMGNDLRVPSIDETPRHLSRRVHRLALEDDEPDAAPGALLVIGGMGIGWRAVEIAECGEVRLEDEAVAQVDFADRER